MDMEGKGSFYIYILDAFGTIACRGRFAVLDDAKAHVARTRETTSHGAGRAVSRAPNSACDPPLGRARASRERRRPLVRAIRLGRACHHGRRNALGSRVVEDGVPVGAVLVAEHGQDDEAVAYLFRRGDGPRLIYSLDDFEALAGLLDNYLGAVRLDDWFSLTEEWPRDLASLLEPMLLVTGPAD